MADAPQRVTRARLAALGLVVLGLAAAIAIAVGAWTRRTSHGWRGAYYPEPDFGGTPILRRDPKIAFQWLFGAALPGLPDDHFTVRWETCLVLEEGQELEVRLGSDDGTRMFVDGRKVLDNWRPQTFHWTTGTVHLQAGSHALVVEYFEGTGNAEVTAELHIPGLHPEPVPLPWLHLPEGDPGTEAPCD